MQTSSVSPSVLPTAIKNYQFEQEAKQTLGVKKKGKWRNYSGTLEQKAYTIDLIDVYQQPSKIIGDIYNLKLKHKDQTFFIVPTAGWEHKKTIAIKGLVSSDEAAKVLEEEYGASFSLSPLSTALNASVVLRVSREAQKMEIIFKKGAPYLSVTGGVRFNDADQFLQSKGYALPPNPPTLHVLTLIGAIVNGCYGPDRDGGPMSINVKSMEVINAYGQLLRLSPKKNLHLFEIIKDCHLGVCFVAKTLFKIEPKFLMERRDILFQDVNALKEAMQKENYIGAEHFLAMYIPADIKEKGKHVPRIRITNFERTNKKPPEHLKTQAERDEFDSRDLMLTEAGEPVIHCVTEDPRLNQFIPFLLKAAALKTFGTKQETFHIDYSAPSAHVLRTYTSLKIRDFNFLIQVEGVEDGKDLFLQLWEITENLLKQQGKKEQYPLLNMTSRYIKGLYYPDGKEGIAPLAVDKPHQGILSFEFVTYAPMAATAAFKELLDAVTNHLGKTERKYNFHPGKDMPENITTLKQIIKGNVKQLNGLKNFKKAVYELHGGKENIPYSPFLTPQKKVFLGFDKDDDAPDIVQKVEVKEVKPLDPAKEKDVLQTILKYASEDKEHHKKTIKAVTQRLETLS